MIIDEPIKDPIKIFLADDHAVVRKGMEALIATQPDMRLLGMATNGEEAIVGAIEIKPDVVLLDIQMPEKDGVTAAAEIKKAMPECKILMLTSFGDDQTVFSAIKAGAHGFLLKTSSPQELLEAIRQVHKGMSPMHPDIARKMLQEIKPSTPQDVRLVDPLTEREIEILILVARGLSNQEIADKLFISERTARTHLSHILAKLHLANRTQAALYALKEGLARLDDQN